MDSVWNFPTTRALLDSLHSAPSLRRLCGWDRVGDIPSEATFSRAFAAFASGELPQQMHAALIHTHLGPKLIGHISRDATAIPAREHPAPKPPPPPPPPKKKRGRPAKDEPPRPPKPPTRVMLQPTRSLAENLADLPIACNVGCKRNSQGYQESWTGYKLHLDCADGDIPVSALLTSASLHDSQVAIPLAQLTAGRVCNLYDLADSAYDVPQILAFSRTLGHVPLIDPHPSAAASSACAATPRSWPISCSACSPSPPHSSSISCCSSAVVPAASPSVPRPCGPRLRGSVSRRPATNDKYAHHPDVRAFALKTTAFSPTVNSYVSRFGRFCKRLQRPPFCSITASCFLWLCGSVVLTSALCPLTSAL